jgi:hypothetical protein
VPPPSPLAVPLPWRSPHWAVVPALATTPFNHPVAKSTSKKSPLSRNLFWQSL